jgi:hypothetical protein
MAILYLGAIFPDSKGNTSLHSCWKVLEGEKKHDRVKLTSSGTYINNEASI